MVAALELGLGDRIERIPATPSPLRVTPDLAAHSPLMKIPILVTDDCLGLFLVDCGALTEDLVNVGE